MLGVAKTIYGGSARRRLKTFRGGCMTIGAAILPFGLTGIQHYVKTRKHSSGKNKKHRRRTRNTNRRRSRSKLTPDFN
jgi:hypothetical protein